MPTLIQYIPNTISFLPPPPLLPILPTPQLISVFPISPSPDPFLLCFPSEKSDPSSNINNIWHSRMQKNLPYTIVSGLDRESYPVEGNRFHQQAEQAEVLPLPLLAFYPKPQYSYRNSPMKMKMQFIIAESGTEPSKRKHYQLRPS